MFRTRSHKLTLKWLNGKRHSMTNVVGCLYFLYGKLNTRKILGKMRRERFINNKLRQNFHSSCLLITLD